MTGAHYAAVQAFYEPTARQLTDQLPVISEGLSTALAGLAADPTATRAGMVAIQLAGAITFINKLREALAREATGSDA